jgi:hypothetical protein
LAAIWKLPAMLPTGLSGNMMRAIAPACDMGFLFSSI